MRRILNTFKYGSIGVKLILLATIICGLASLSLLACAIIFGQLIWFFAFIFSGFITVSLAQTFAIQGGIDEEEDKNAAVTKGGSSENDDNDESDYSFSYAEEYRFVNKDEDDSDYSDEDEDYDYPLEEDDYDLDGVSKKKKKRNKKEKKIKNKKNRGKGNKDKDNKDKETGEQNTKIKKLKKSKADKEKKNSKAVKKHRTASVSKKALIVKPKKVALKNDIPKVEKKAKIDIDYKAMVKKDIKDSKKDLAKKKELLEAELEIEEVNSDAAASDDNTNDNNKHSKNFVPEPITAETVRQYNIKRIRKTLHKYKVKRDHKLAIIDRCETYNISQTPAYIWVDGNDFHILLIEKEPRHLVLSTFKVGRIKYLKKQPVDINTDYEVFNTKSMVTDLFRPYLPDYNQSNVDSDLNYYKNLYGIGPGIYFTNNSAKQLIDFFGFGMDVDDKVTESKRVNLYFKDAYKANIMVRDNVLDANGYADRISSILEEMAASNLSYNEFKETLNLMIKNKFITKEFGMYYMDVRDKKHS